MGVFWQNFTIYIDKFSGHLQMEMIKVLCQTYLKQKFDNVGTFQFYSSSIEDKLFLNISFSGPPSVHALCLAVKLSLTWRLYSMFWRLYFFGFRTLNDAAL